MALSKIVIIIALMMLSVAMGALIDHGKQVTTVSPNTPSQGQQQTALHDLSSPVADDRLEDTHQAPQEILLSPDQYLVTVPANLDVHDMTTFDCWMLGTALNLAKTKAQELQLHQVASDIEIWVKAHPWKAAFYLASSISLFAPEILSLPALEALGFGAVGVRAGSLAAKIQSVIGPIAARSVFAIWQSARMGGYGVEYVNGGVRALVALADAAEGACNPLKDCKGLMNDGGGRLGEGMMIKAFAVVACGWVVGLVC